MIRIAICDDEINICEKIDEYIRQYNGIFDIKTDVSVYYDGMALKQAILRKETFDIIFLDVNMKEMNGIVLGEFLREQQNDEETKIVYVSWEKEYAFEIITNRPFGFLVKPISKEEVFTILSKIISKFFEEDKVFVVAKGAEGRQVKMKDIYYFESRNRKVYVSTQEGSFEYYGRMKDIEKKLNHALFWRIHKSYIVNYRNVERFSYKELHMKDGVKLPVSQQNRSSVRKKQLLYFGQEEEK